MWPWPDCLLALVCRSSPPAPRAWSRRPARAGLVGRAGPQPVPSRSGRQSKQGAWMWPIRGLIAPTRQAQFLGREPTKATKAERQSLRIGKKVVHRPEPVRTTESAIPSAFQSSEPQAHCCPEINAQGQGVWWCRPHNLRSDGCRRPIFPLACRKTRGVASSSSQGDSDSSRPEMGHRPPHSCRERPPRSWEVRRPKLR